MKSSKQRVSYGDFQTPPELVRSVVEIVRKLCPAPASILEPTCGLGSFLLEAVNRFPKATALGVEINPEYVDSTRAKAQDRGLEDRLRVEQGDFFDVDWLKVTGALPDPLLVIGNPPWVTNAILGGLGSTNLPKKSNFQGHRGFDAITGKSNFDISEWMLIQMLDWFAERNVTLAMLCKTTVARKLLRRAWRGGHQLAHASMYSIDAAEHFQASVSACLLVLQSGNRKVRPSCSLYDRLDALEPGHSIGFEAGSLLADAADYRRYRDFDGESPIAWRSGIKHDCSRVMELAPMGSVYKNGLGKTVELESEYLFPLLKSSDLANGRIQTARRCMLVPQRQIGQETDSIADTAPRTWGYLQAHGDLLDNRRSSIYREKPRFSIFGVGPYSFAPWKVAISGLYRSSQFRVVPPIGGKPVVFDDTVYFLPCETKAQAVLLAELISGAEAQRLLHSLTFWDMKRPITAELLRRVDLLLIAEVTGRREDFRRAFAGSAFCADRQSQYALAF